ncbi:MAG: YerC/YecD family TrpR-related protein [Clostridia bacterium]
MNSNTDKIYTDEIGLLYEAISKLSSPSDCRAFFEDICSVKELHAMAQRLQVAKMLNEGQSFVQITEHTGASTATISRVSRCLSKGSGGYKKVF